MFRSDEGFFASNPSANSTRRNLQRLMLLLIGGVMWALASANPPSIAAPKQAVSAAAKPRVATQASVSRYPGIGRVATPAEVQAWNIDVRSDFTGLPAGKGTVAQGQDIWDGRCAMCHGTFGESNEVFTPVVGNTTAADMERGRVAALNDNKTPQRTTLMKVATVSTLWDYIYRAMPWYAPRSLTVDETYAVLAYILYLGDIVPDDFTLSDQSIRQVQARMPNRNGMTRQHGLWTADGKPDVQGNLCMNDCKPFIQIGSVLPDYARNAHGNLADQNRPWGPFRGADTTRPPLPQLPVDRASDSPMPALGLMPSPLTGDRP